jgi:hypothetical protein
MSGSGAAGEVWCLGVTLVDGTQEANGLSPRPLSLLPGSPALAGTALATILGWGAVRPELQALARASRYA